MNFLHSREQMSSGQIVEVDCSHQCNVRLMTDSNFQNYKHGNRFEYLGGHYQKLPARIQVPSTGNWNIVLDLGGGSASIRHSIRIYK